MSGASPYLGWGAIVRLGLVQTALGSIVVLTTSTLNRVMVVELALPAALPGALVALHYAIQVLRPRWGYGSDMGGRRTPWIVGGVAVLALGGVGAAAATALMSAAPAAGLALAVCAFLLIGAGVGAAGTTLLALLASEVAPKRRAAAATIVWLMMIFGMVLTATVAGHLLDPFSMPRLLAVTSGLAAAAVLLTVLAVWRIETEGRGRPVAAAGHRTPFLQALSEIWAERKARLFAIFVFVSMLAYSAQDLILEPYAGIVFGFSPGESTRLAGVQHAGVFCGMVIVALMCSWLGGRLLGSLRFWTVGGCLGSALALAAVAAGGLVGPAYPLRATVFVLGCCNGVFAVAAIGSMMAFAGAGRQAREGVRMGLWGAAQAIAFGLGGLLGALSVDAVRLLMGSPLIAYVSVFLAEAAMFAVAAWLAARLEPAHDRPVGQSRAAVPDLGMASISGR